MAVPPAQPWVTSVSGSPQYATGSPSAVSSMLVIVVPSGDPQVVREAHVTAYHVLWELVHVFLEARVV